MLSLHPKHVVRRIKSHHDFMWDYMRDFFDALFRPAMVFLIFLGVSVTLMFAFAFYLLEGDGVNPNVHNFFDAVYFSTSTMTTVGFGDISPVTTAGRALTILMMFLGTGLFVSYTAVISTVIIGIEQAKGIKRREVASRPHEDKDPA